MISNDTYVYMNEEDIHPSLKCKLCCKPFIEPVAVPNGERYCRKCVSRIVCRESINEPTNKNVNGNDPITRLQQTVDVTEPLVIQLLGSLLVRCTKCNAINIPRDALSHHIDSKCSKTKISCNAADIKCSWTDIREKLPEHLQECIFEPLRPAFEQSFRDLNELKRRLENLETRLNQSNT